jgi:type IV pilus assembly protein PilF
MLLQLTTISTAPTMKKILAIFLALTLNACTTTNTHHYDKTEAAQANIKLGMYYLLEQGDTAKAKQKFLKATQQAPKNSAVWYSLAYFEEQTGDVEMAEKHYLNAIKLSPKLGEAQNNYGAFLCRQGNYKKSITYFINATNDPNYLNTAKAYENAAQCALKIPDKTLAEKYHQLALQRGLSK